MTEWQYLIAWLKKRAEKLARDKEGQARRKAKRR